MRIVSWNCFQGLANKEKVKYFRSLNADIAIIPEVREANAIALKPDSLIWDTNNRKSGSKMGLGILTFNGFIATELPRHSAFELYLPAVISKGKISFNLLAVWSFYSACKQGKYKGVVGIEYDAINYYKDLFKDPCLIAGDWNNGPTLKNPSSHYKIVEILSKYGMTSLYHTFTKEKQGSESVVTYKHNRGNTHFIDHIYGSKSFVDKMSSFEIQPMSKVVKSDHAPLILDVEFKKK